VRIIIFPAGGGLATAHGRRPRAGGRFVVSGPPGVPARVRARMRGARAGEKSGFGVREGAPTPNRP
jgi:hypothetical protein